MSSPKGSVTSFPQIIFLSAIVLLTGCRSHPSGEASPADLQGKTQAWFLEYWGEPSAQAQWFFGEETWAYFGMVDGKQLVPFSHDRPNDCSISLHFDQNGTLNQVDYSGC